MKSINIHRDITIKFIFILDWYYYRYLTVLKVLSEKFKKVAKK